MNQQLTAIESTTPRRVVPWHGLFWVAVTLSILARAFGVISTSWGPVLLLPWAIMLGGMAMRPGDYELSRRRQPRPLIAAFVLALVVEGVAVVADLSGWWLTAVSAVPAIPAALFAYLHLRTPPPPTAADKVA